MIKSIRLQNFFGFQDCTINLEKGENVLVGINGSGKSNFFKAVKLLRYAYNKNLKSLIANEFGGFYNILNAEIGKKGDNRITIEYTFEIDEDYTAEIREIHYQIQFIINADSINYYLLEKVWGEHNGEKVDFIIRERNKVKTRLAYDQDLIESKNLGFEETESCLDMQISNSIAVFDIAHIIVRTIVYQEFNISSIKKGESLRPLPESLLEDGSNTISVLKNIFEKQPDAFNLVNEALRKVNEKYKEIKLIVRPGVIELFLLEENLYKETFAINISDGTLRFLCLLAVLYNPNRGWVICIDEPELGLHPDMLHTLYEAIKHAAQTSQIIISTHSSLLLDWFDIENVRVFEKDKDNATIVKQYKDEDFEGWYDKYMLGDMWLKGDIGGKRW